MSDPELPASQGVDASKTVTLSEKDVRDAARLLRLISDEMPWENLSLSRLEGSTSRSAKLSRRDAEPEVERLTPDDASAEESIRR